MDHSDKKAKMQEPVPVLGKDEMEMRTTTKQLHEADDRTVWQGDQLLSDADNKPA